MLRRNSRPARLAVRRGAFGEVRKMQRQTQESAKRVFAARAPSHGLQLRGCTLWRRIGAAGSKECRVDRENIEADELNEETWPKQGGFRSLLNLAVLRRHR